MLVKNVENGQTWRFVLGKPLVAKLQQGGLGAHEAPPMLQLPMPDPYHHAIRMEDLMSRSMEDMVYYAGRLRPVEEIMMACCAARHTTGTMQEAVGQGRATATGSGAAAAAVRDAVRVLGNGIEANVAFNAMDVDDLSVYETDCVKIEEAPRGGCCASEPPCRAGPPGSHRAAGEVPEPGCRS